MYLARFETPLGGFVLGAILLEPPVGDAAAVRAFGDVVGAAADLLEGRSDVAAGVLRRYAANGETTHLLLGARAADEMALRGLLLGWNALNDAVAGSCTLLERDAFNAAVQPLPGIHIQNVPEQRDGIQFFPAYRVADRGAPLVRELLRAAAAFSLCWCVHPAQPAPSERAVRQNLVRMGRDWVPHRVRATQEALARRYLAGAPLVTECALVGDEVMQRAALAVLQADAAAAGSREGFSQPVCAPVPQADPALLVLEQLVLPEQERAAAPGNAVEPGFLRRVLCTPRTQPARPRSAARAPVRPVRAFVSYAHEDRAYAERLKVSCAQLARDGWIELWSDAEIVPGQAWFPEISGALEQADLVILLVSPDFMASDFCWGVELERALERHAAGSAAVLPIHVRRADVTNAPFDALQSLPSARRPVSAWGDADEAWYDVAGGIRRLIEHLSSAISATGGQHAR